MKKTEKIWLAAAAVLVVLGAAMFTAALAGARWDIAELDTNNYETKSLAVDEHFDSIAISSLSADVRLLPAEDGRCRVLCRETAGLEHSIELRGGVLSIQQQDNRSWKEHIGIFLEETEIILYLPEQEYKSLTIEFDTGDIAVPGDFRCETVDIIGSTGDVEIDACVLESLRISVGTGQVSLENMQAVSIELEAATGKAELGDVRCETLRSKVNTGDISLEDVVVSKRLSAQCGTGDVEFENCDAGELYIRTETGDVYGSLLSEKMFLAASDTGTVDVPKTTKGGICDVSTDTGDIIIKIV